MSDTSGRREFVMSAVACLAAAPAVLAESPKPELSDEAKAAVGKAIADCRQANEARRTEEQAAYGKALVARFGPAVLEVIRDTTAARAKALVEAAPIPKRDLEAVKTELWDAMPPTFEWKVVEKTDTTMRFEVRKCPLAEAMRRHGAPEVGFAYYCAFDPGFCEGLNPALRFTRTKTLMMGDDRCDHTYELPRPTKG